MLRHFVYFLIWLVKLFYPKYWLVSTSAVYGLARHETGMFQSDAFTKTNNLFGMKHPKSRPTLSKLGGLTDSDGGLLGNFTTWLHSIIDFFYWLKYFKIPASNFVTNVSTAYNASASGHLEAYSNHVKSSMKFTFLIPLFIMIIYALVSTINKR